MLLWLSLGLPVDISSFYPIPVISPVCLCLLQNSSLSLVYFLSFRLFYSHSPPASFYSTFLSPLFSYSLRPHYLMRFLHSFIAFFALNDTRTLYATPLSVIRVKKWYGTFGLTWIDTWKLHLSLSECNQHISLALYAILNALRIHNLSLTLASLVTRL